MLTDTLVVFDHLQKRTTILVNVDTRVPDLEAAYATRLPRWPA